ncbi:alpha-tocopherol transfer protein-like [Folsomia candida]|uniref:Clavesin-2 n=1 Tax=Folsomia candida TaxID=158441 RepID=A0A226DNE4_FOLCA|nr:alpha-tocopherol transfer protein-like [Folsomia candida]OXA45746.1 Clavesin-2 [Folsomia candida]
MVKSQTKKGELFAELKSKIAEHEKLFKIKDIFDDALLSAFLRGKKFNVDDTLKCLEHFVYIRTEKYKNFSIKYMNPSTLITLDIQSIKTLKYMDDKGRRIGVEQSRFWDTSKFGVQELFAELLLHVEESMRSYMIHSEDNGGVMIYDLGYLGIQHVRLASPRMVIQGFDLFLNNIPARLAAVHLMNVSAIGRLLVAFTLRYLKAKVRSRIFVHADFASLHEHIAASVLPVSLGGELSDEDAYEIDFVPRIRSQQRFYTQIAQLARHS